MHEPACPTADGALSSLCPLAHAVGGGKVRATDRDFDAMPDTVPLVTDPFARFQDWMTEAWAHEPEDANAMTLATATPDCTPAARIVLLKGADARGFVFYTNKESR